MEWFIWASWRLWRRVLAKRIPLICFRVVSSVPQNGFVGRAADGLPIVASPLRRFTAFRRCLSIRAGGVFGGEAVDTGARAAKQCCRRCFSAPLLFRRFPAARGADWKRQNSLSCALCCAALRLIPINESADARFRT